MYLEVYPDIIFILNFLLDYILLFLVKKINKRESSLLRRMIASAFGALIAAIVGMNPWMNRFVRFFVMNIATSSIMLMIAFGRLRKSEMLKQMLVLYLITYTAGGLINSLYYHTNIRMQLITIGNRLIYSNLSIKYIMAAALISLAFSVFFIWMIRKYRSKPGAYLKTELRYGDNRIFTKALRDTGNSLCEPISGKPVIILEKPLLFDLLSKEQQEEFNMIEKIYYGKGVIQENLDGIHTLSVRIIPYQSIGKPQGILPGLVIDKVLIHTDNETICIENVIAAICENQLSAKKDYQVILHKDMVS